MFRRRRTSAVRRRGRGVDEERVLIDEAATGERANELSAPEDDEVGTLLVLEVGDGVGREAQTRSSAIGPAQSNFGWQGRVLLALHLPTFGQA